MNGPAIALVSVIAANVFAPACAATNAETVAQSHAPRSYRMGFSAEGPRFDIATILKSIDDWSKHADGALDHRDVPWKYLLKGGDAEAYIQKEVLPLMNLYRTRGFKLACTADLANGIDRTKEASDLVAMGRSITEPEVQKVYVDYVTTFAKLVKPDYFGLGSELNLFGDNIPAKTYEALVQMDAKAAREVKKASPNTLLYVSVQAEWAWGRMGGASNYRGCEKILKDFPFIQALGISSYAAFGWDDPDQIPTNYYSKLLGGRKLPVLMVEGGWPSTNVAGVSGMTNVKSSPEKQARWVRKLATILDEGHAVFVGTLTYTDLDFEHIPEFKGTIMPMFCTMGMTDITFKPKPALAAWDTVFRRPLKK